MYHYKACGLDNVWLENGYTEKDTRYGRAVSVSDADQLHQLLALQVASKSGSLSGQELRFLRNSMLLSQKALGDMLGVTDQAVSLWERNGNIPVAPDAVVRMLVLKTLGGDGDVCQVIERVNTVERLVNQKIVARARDHKWTAESEADTPEVATA